MERILIQENIVKVEKYSETIRVHNLENLRIKNEMKYLVNITALLPFLFYLKKILYNLIELFQNNLENPTPYHGLLIEVVA